MDHAARARVLQERGYTTPAINFALQAMANADDDLQREMRLVAADCLDRKGMSMAAIAHANVVLAEQPDNARALAIRGAAYHSQWRSKDAHADLKRAVELDPNNKRAWEVFANASLDIKDFDSQDAAIEGLAKLGDVPAYILQRRGQRRLEAGDASGEADLRTAVVGGDPMSAYLLTQFDKSLDSGAELALFAFDREKRNMPEEAIELYQAAIKKGFDGDSRRDVRVHRNLATMLANAGRNDEALDVVRSLTDAHDDRPEAWLFRARIDGESTSFEKAYDLSAEEGCVPWARHLLGAGRKDEALVVCTARLDEDADDLAARVLLGEVYHSLERSDDAKGAWLQAEALGETRARELRVQAFGIERGLDFFNEALRLLDGRDRDGAVAEFENAIDELREETNVPGDEPHRYLAKSLYNSAFLRELRVDDAILEPNLREAVELDPTYTDAMLALGNMCLRTERLEEGLGWFAKVGELDPMSGQAWYYRARHHHDKGDHTAVLEDATRAFTAYSTRGQGRFAADAIMLRGEANENLGNLIDAKRDYDLAYDYGHPTGYARGDQIRERIAIEHPDSDEAIEVMEKVIERINDGECPWGQIDLLEHRTSKDSKATALVSKLKEDEALDEDETEWLVEFLEGA